MRRYLVIGLLALCSACSNAGSTLLKEGADADTSDGVGQLELTLPDLSPDTASDLPFDLVPVDLLEDTNDAFVGCEPGTGCDYEQCEENVDCLSGFCMPHLGDQVCTPYCVEDCAPGFSCRMADWLGPDLAFLCFSNYPYQCRPCEESDDCEVHGGGLGACVLLEGEGSFCSASCQADLSCPDGYTCQPAASVEGTTTDLCMPDTGNCPCTDTSIAEAASTPCHVENEFGLCTGDRICQEAGLTPCSAKTPAEEVCNGLDDDCDGQTDEATCDDANPCTEDQCGGEDGCSNAPLTGTECMDGDPCTVADHCDDGLCVGSPLVCDDVNPCTDDSCQGDEGCVHVPNFSPCDDGEPCTVQDQCTDGVCAGYKLDCQCELDSDCAQLEDGDLCNGVLECDSSSLPFVCVVKPGTVISCPAPEGLHAFCNAAACNPETGACSIVAAHDGLACDDDDACTVGETCSDGLCQGGVAVNCNDGNSCTDDGCDQATGCTHEDNAADCEDGNPCTTVDLCQDGSCVGTLPLTCNDTNSCTDDACDPASGCTFTPNSQLCDDGDACTLGDQCANGSCQASGVLDCDDNNLCTSDSCSPAQGCAHSVNSLPCDDGDACTSGDVCKQGQCAPGPLLDCNDSNPCTDDSCNAGACVHQANDAACDDLNACTVGDKCQGGQCQGTASLYCNDDNVCTDDSCDLKLGCIHVANIAPCNDGSACTVGDACADGTCAGGPPLVCADNNPCTDDSCDPDSGCLFAPNTDSCSDDNACTLDDTCSEGICTGGPLLVCADNNPCTNDGCDPESGCLFEVNTAPCDDGNACTPTDVCADGICVGAGDPACDDGFFCNGEESCDPATGCVAGLAPVTDDGIACTVDACDDDGDIVTHVADDSLCPEGAACRPEFAPDETCIYPLGHAENPAISCLAVLNAGDSVGDGLYWLDPEADGGPFQALCDMSTDGGGWTRVVVIRGNSIAHGDNTGAAGDVAVDGAPGKLADATINLLNTVGYWRFNCTSQSRFVKNVNNTWTSKKYNSENWSMDRNKDLNFECSANRSGYVLSDYPACSAGHLNYVAKDGMPEGGGCYYANAGWNQHGSLWAR